MITILDTETTGLPENYQAPASDIDNWPRAVQIAWNICASTGEVMCRQSFIINPAGFTIPEAAIQKHGITNEHAQEVGVGIFQVLELLAHDLKESTYVVAHNMSYDSRVLGAEFIRAGFDDPFDSVKTICIMELSTTYCHILGSRGYKWPRLEELYTILFDKTIEEAIGNQHDASHDVEATCHAFWELVNRGVISIWQSTLQADIDRLKIAREDLETVKTKKARLMATIEDELAQLKAEGVLLEEQVTQLEESIRAQAVAQYMKSGEKNYGKVNIKLFTETTIENKEVARSWCFLNFPAALTMDERKVKLYARDMGNVPGVRVEMGVPQAQIDSKL